ncbi:MAG: hypothetical protein EWV76_07345 [Microcystis novacekii Mn_MB_F_20050700_S1]|uniref:Uncharacterized protein n=1 Tax=Microcystis novacekii Mn_MB_F_20050700_S1D TaxID=2486266 RepID=A0A552IWP8_9CHRO|nr:MAG: hypothetical protein EWV54_11520 [Microcystis novacekii Mn_MB_F_20050700_S1D]TRU89473.1 MAG: hypothetical protein EWV76_07345 [Microcystis novacekii Mn_MB_F_20050700_S1]
MKDHYDFDQSLQNPYLEKLPRRETSTDPEQLRQQKARRLQELSRIARERYLESGGDPSRSANEQQLTKAEQEEFQNLLSQVFDTEYIERYREKQPQHPTEFNQSAIASSNPQLFSKRDR